MVRLTDRLTIAQLLTGMLSHNKTKNHSLPPDKNAYLEYIFLISKPEHVVIQKNYHNVT